jgi:hypothetical protein
MKYLLFICSEESIGLSPGKEEEIAPAAQAWVAEMESRGVRLEGHQLRPVSEATTVRVRDREAVIADGPFAETREQIAGFDVIDAADLDDAIEVASKHPVASFGTIEIRPFCQ